MSEKQKALDSQEKEVNVGDTVAVGDGTYRIVREVAFDQYGTWLTVHPEGNDTYLSVHPSTSCTLKRRAKKDPEEDGEKKSKKEK